MKKGTLIIASALFLCTANYSNAQFGKLKDKISGKSSKGGGFESFNEETDEMGITGQYHGQVDKRSFGFRFVKEADGSIVNQLHYFENKRSTDPQLKLTMKESYYTKNKVKLFYKWVSASASGYVEIIEVAPNVFAQIKGDRSYNDGPLALDATRTVVDVYAKDKAEFETWDLETAQAQVDVIIAGLNSGAMEKETELWMKNKVFAANVGKVVFSDQDYHLMKRGYINKPPKVDGKNFKTELDMSKNMQYITFFKYPPKVKYAGQEINIEYEINGVKTNRAELRKKSAAWSKMIKILETKDFDYRQHSPRALREYNSYHGQYVQDYAFVYALYQNKDAFKVDQSYDLTVRMYAHRDGENGDLIGEGVVKLKYTKAADEAYTNPDGGVWAIFEEFLNE